MKDKLDLSFLILTGFSYMLNINIVIFWEDVEFISQTAISGLFHDHYNE